MGLGLNSPGKCACAAGEQRVEPGLDSFVVITIQRCVALPLQLVAVFPMLPWTLRETAVQRIDVYALHF